MSDLRTALARLLDVVDRCEPNHPKPVDDAEYDAAREVARQALRSADEMVRRGIRAPEPPAKAVIEEIADAQRSIGGKFSLTYIADGDRAYPAGWAYLIHSDQAGMVGVGTVGEVLGHLRRYVAEKMAAPTPQAAE